jgi:hypothetical protein
LFLASPCTSLSIPAGAASHDLELSHRVSDADAELSTSKSVVALALEKLGLGATAKASVYRLTAEAEAKARRQLDVGKRILDLFRGGALLLDEVSAQ